MDFCYAVLAFIIMAKPVKKNHKSAADIDRQAGALSKEQYIRKKSGMLEQEIRYYQKRLLISAILALILTIGIILRDFVLLLLFEIELDSSMLLKILAVIAYLNIPYFFYKRRQTEAKLEKWNVQLAEYRAKKGGSGG